MSEIAILAGGCFWGMEGLIRAKDGILDTQVGYTGGTTDYPKYEDVKTGATGHAEAIKITFDPTKISYREILLFFFQIHDPTTKNRQGNDIGTQYRSEIFYTSADQKSVAEQVIRDVDTDGYWGAPAVTKLSPAQTFWDAEDFHQDYLVKYPDGYTCHFPRSDWRLKE